MSKQSDLVGLSGDAANLEAVSTAYGSGPLSNRNKVINGAMVIDQRNGGSLVSNANGFITDRWSLGKYDPTGGAYSGQQVADGPSGFTHSLKVTVTTSVSQATSAYWQAFQRIEGYSVSDLGFGTASPKTITVSFWVKASVTGTYSFAVFNEGVGSTNRAYATTYTVNAANTWEYKTVTLTGDGASGSGLWGTDNGKGMGIYFDLGCGVNEEVTANTWATGNYRRVAGTVRLMDTLNATWQITGVQLEVGSVATPFEHRSFGQELPLCQRYYQVSYSGSYREYVYNVHRFPQTYIVAMRASPSTTAEHNGANPNNGVESWYVNSGPSGFTGGAQHFTVGVSTVAANLSPGSTGMVDIGLLTIYADAEL